MIYTWDGSFSFMFLPPVMSGEGRERGAEVPLWFLYYRRAVSHWRGFRISGHLFKYKANRNNRSHFYPITYK